jgi:hypothetical protein
MTEQELTSARAEAAVRLKGRDRATRRGQADDARNMRRDRAAQTATPNLLTSGYDPAVEVLPDPSLKNRNVAFTHVEVGDVVNILPILNAPQPNDPNSLEMQGLRQAPRECVRMPLTRSRWSLLSYKVQCEI